MQLFALIFESLLEKEKIYQSISHLFQKKTSEMFLRPENVIENNLGLVSVNYTSYLHGLSEECQTILVSRSLCYNSVVRYDA